VGEVKGFMKHVRAVPGKEAPDLRIMHWREFTQPLCVNELARQGARCMSCGVPFCMSGCPIGNLIPEWNHLVYRGRWQDAVDRLHRTNNFPEFTGRVCPAPCEHSCVLGINEPAVSIKCIEEAIIERAYREGRLRPEPPKTRTGKKVAVIGSGPSGLACADQLNRAGHLVTVYEKNERPGGLLRFGIPDYKLEKRVVERRLKRMEEEGVVFKTGVHVGKCVSAKEIVAGCDAVVLCGGAEVPRDLPVPGRELEGIAQAMQFLSLQNRRNSGLPAADNEVLSAKGKHVVVIGGGDTGSDCVGTSHRQGAANVVQLELLPKPPDERAPDNPWPQWAFTHRLSTSHEEGIEQMYAVMTKKFSGKDGKVNKLHAVRLEYGAKDPATGRRPMKEIPGSDFEIQADLVLLAMGFLGPEKTGLLKELGVELDGRGNVKYDAQKMTSVPGVFTAGDMARGQSLVVWAIQEGRRAAQGVDRYLMGSTNLLANR